MHSRLRPFDLPLAVVLLSAMLGLAVAYEPTAAVHRFGWIAAGLLLYAAISRWPVAMPRDPGRGPWLLPAVTTLLPTGVALLFLFTHDWTQPADKLRWLDPVQHVLARRPFSLPGPALHPNVAGGLLACLLPLYLSACWPGSGQPRPTIWRWVAWLLAPVVLLALLMSRLRGGWLAVAITTAAFIYWRARPGWVVAHRRPLLTTAFLVLTGSVLAVAVTSSGAPLPRPDRWRVWIDSWYLAWDYPVSGLGLGGFPMAYSSYALLVHVPHTMHAHNLVLDFWLDQGAIGLGALGWVTGLAFTAPRVTGGEAWAGAAKLSWLATLTLGFVDDVHYGYGGAGALLLFVPIAVLSRSLSAPAPRPSTLDSLVTASRARHRRIGRWVATLALGMVLVPAMRATVASNRAALAQTRVELATYHWPSWPIQDAVRRADVSELGMILDQYQLALSLAPAHASANMRLGQVEMSLGEYGAARRHLAAAYAAAPHRPAIRQLYGESLAAAGQVEEAAALWRTLTFDVGQLDAREAWYRIIGDAQRAEWVREAAARATSP